MSDLKVKKSVYKVKFFKVEYEEAAEIHDLAKDEFFNRVKKIQYDLNVYDKDFDGTYQESPGKEADKKEEPGSSSNSFSEPDIDMEDDDLPSKSVSHPPWAKTLYRKVTFKTHPDRLIKLQDEDEKSRLVKIYEEVVEAYANEDYSRILMAAVDLNIEIPFSEEIIEILSSQSEKYVKETIEIKETLFWLWWHISDDEKENIVMNFVKQKGWTSSGAAVRRSRNDGRPGKSLSWARKKLKS